MKKTSRKNNVTVNRAFEKNAVRKWLAGFLAVSTAFTMLSGSAATLMAEETSSPSTEYALAGAGSGQDVTVHFGNDEDKDINIHVNPETGLQESETLAGAGSESKETEIETEAETEPETENVEEKRVYTYEDDKVLVTATLEKADAVPDDAVLRVTPVTADSDGYNYDAYMDALNDKASDNSSEDKETDTDEKAFTDENTLLYDIAFIVCDYDEDGKPIDGTEREFEPEEGTVSVSITFRQDQLTDEINAESTSDIVVGHLPLNERVRGDSETTKDATDICKDDITVEPITADKNIEGGQSVVFTTDSFSVYYIGRYDWNKQIQIQFEKSDESPDLDAKLRRAYVYVEDTQDPDNKHVMIPIDLDSQNYDRSTGIYTINGYELSQGSLDLSDWERTYSVQILQQFDQIGDWKYGPKSTKKEDVDQIVTRANEPGLVGMYYFTLPADYSDLSKGDYKITAKMVPYSTKAELLAGTNETDVLKAVLGDAVYYGIIANSYTQVGDTQTNFAVKTFTSNADTGGDLSENPGNIVVGDILDGGKLKIRTELEDFSSTIYYGSQIDPGKIIMDSNQYLVPMDQAVINAYVNKLIQNATPISSQNPLKLTKTAGNLFFVDTTALPEDAVLYISLDEGVAPQSNDVGRELTDLKKAAASSDQLRINKLPTQTIVFQTSSDSIHLNQMMFDNNGGFDFSNTVSDKSKTTKNGVLAEYCPTVFWTSPTTSEVQIDGSTAGTFIFPAAFIEWHHTSCGWMVCNNAKGTSGEWHNLYKEMPEYHMIPRPDDLKTALRIVKLWQDEAGNETDPPEGRDSIKVNVKRKLATPGGSYNKVVINVCYTESDGTPVKLLTKVVYVKKDGPGANKLDIVIENGDPSLEFHAGNMYPRNLSDPSFVDMDGTINLETGVRRVIRLNNLDQYAKNGEVEVCISGNEGGMNSYYAGMIEAWISVPEDSYIPADFSVAAGTQPDLDIFGTKEVTLSGNRNWEADINNLDKEVDIVDDYYDSNWEDKLGYRWFYYVEEAEESAEGFEVSVSPEEGVNYGIITVTNKIPSTSITVSKKWDDNGDAQDDGNSHNDDIVVSVYRVLTPVVPEDGEKHGSADTLSNRPVATVKAETAAKTGSEDNSDILEFELTAIDHWGGPITDFDAFELEYDFLKNKAFNAEITFTTDKPIDADHMEVGFWCGYPPVIDVETDQNIASLTYPIESVGDNEYKVIIPDMMITNPDARGQVYQFKLRTYGGNDAADITGFTSAVFDGEGVGGESKKPVSGGNGTTTTTTSPAGGTGGSNQNGNNGDKDKDDTFFTAQDVDNSSGVIGGGGSGGGSDQNPPEGDGEGDQEFGDGNTNLTTIPDPETPQQGGEPARGTTGNDSDVLPGDDPTAPTGTDIDLPDGAEFVQRITLNKDNNWTETKDGLPKQVVRKENGVDVLYECSYYVVEEQVPDGYEVTYSTGDVDHPVKEGDIDITNTKLGELTIYKKTNGVHDTPADTEFYITGPDEFSMTIKYADFTVSESEEQDVKVASYTLHNLKPGNYVVTENGSRTEIGGALHFDNEDNSKYDLLITYKNSNDGENKTGAQAAIGVGSDSHVEIDNDYITTYAMPATGGEGTRRMLLLGIMLIAFAGAGFILVRRRRVMTR